MADDDAVLKEMLKHLQEAARRIGAARHLMQKEALVNDPNYLMLRALLSEALEVTEAARREAHRRQEAGSSGTSALRRSRKMR